MFKYLPKQIYNEVIKLKNVTEIRLRVNQNPIVYTNNQAFTINKYEVTALDLNEIVLKACKRSLYGYEEYLKRGFITTDYGERIGISGEFILKGEEVEAIKNYTSLCIRIPNQVIGVSNKFYNVYEGGSVLIVSKCGVGKTTFLRDLTRNISVNTNQNIVVIDERNEIASKSENGGFFLGKTVDVLTFANKKYGFTHAIRSLNPYFIVTDELVTNNDFKGVNVALNGGVNVIASMHGSDSEILSGKILKNGRFKGFNYFIYIKKVGLNRVITAYDRNLKAYDC